MRTFWMIRSSFRKLLPTTHGAKFAILHIAASFGLAILGLIGALQMPYLSDQTGLCFFITVVLLLGIYMIWKRRWNQADRIGDALVNLGFLGTVLGFVIVLLNVSPEAAGRADMVQVIIASLLSGMGTALYTTLLGLIGYLWLDLCAWVLK